MIPQWQVRVTVSRRAKVQSAFLWNDWTLEMTIWVKSAVGLHRLTVRHCFSFLDAGKLKCFHTWDLKVAGASTVSQTLSLAASATLALQLDLYKRAECKGWWVHPTSLCSASLQLNNPKSFCSKEPIVWKSYVLEGEKWKWRQAFRLHRSLSNGFFTVSQHASCAVGS